MSRPPVTLQISLSPSDYRHAQLLLPHQLRAWQGQVTEVLLTVDFHRSSGRFSARWEEGKDKIVPLAQSIPRGRVVTVDYSRIAMAKTSAEFFGGRPIPAKDFRGGPYYSYFFALAEAKNRYVLHVDADMFFGGGNQSWIDEAIAHMSNHPEVLFAAPLSGPPAADGRLHSQQATVEPGESHAFRFDTMSTRLFLLDRVRFRSTIGALQPRPPPAWRSIIKALVEGNPPHDLPENLFTDAMRAGGLVRREFLGRTPGMWSLHPPYRCTEFYRRLSEIIRQVETGVIPAAQRGDHDINDSLIDWSEATAALKHDRWWKRLLISN